MCGLFRARWTDDIHDEWTRNVLKGRSDLSAESLARTRKLMNESVMDCLVTGYEQIAAALTLPDPDDTHVLAAAIKSGANAIITFNLRDFPAAELAKYDIEAQHPDDFIQHQFGLDTSLVVVAAQRCRARLRNPPYGVDEYLDRLERQSLPLSVAELRPFSGVL